MKQQLASGGGGKGERGALPPPHRVPFLHEEVLKFEQQVRETSEELQAREMALRRATSVVNYMHPNATVHVFGSCATNLRLPNGDIDLMIKLDDYGVNDRALLAKFKRALRESTTASRVLPLPHAKVPIIKWVDRETGLHLDASFNNRGALRTTELMAHSSAQLPALRPLVLFLKSQLMSHGLNETATGGVGSYLLTNMVRHLLLRPVPILSPLPSMIRSRIETFLDKNVPGSTLQFEAGELHGWQRMRLHQFAASMNGVSTKSSGSRGAGSRALELRLDDGSSSGSGKDGGDDGAGTDDTFHDCDLLPLIRGDRDLEQAYPSGYAPMHSVARHDLGGMLLLFYWYYGFHFDTSSTIVMLPGEGTRVAESLAGVGSRMEQQHIASHTGFLPHDPGMLSLNDPGQPRSDIGIKAFRFGMVRSLFRQSYRTLLERVAVVGAASASAASAALVNTAPSEDAVTFALQVAAAADRERDEIVDRGGYFASTKGAEASFYGQLGKGSYVREAAAVNRSIRAFAQAQRHLRQVRIRFEGQAGEVMKESRRLKRASAEDRASAVGTAEAEEEAEEEEEEEEAEGEAEGGSSRRAREAGKTTMRWRATPPIPQPRLLLSEATAPAPTTMRSVSRARVGGVGFLRRPKLRTA